MDKKLAAGILATGIALGAGGSKVLTGAPVEAASSHTVFQNEQTWVALRYPDGGAQYGHRQCDYVLKADGGREKEPCSEWVLTQPQASAFETFTAAAKSK